MPIFKSLVWLDPEKIPAPAGFEPGTFRSRGGRLNHQANEAVLSESKRDCWWEQLEKWLMIWGVKTRTIYLKITDCLFSVFFFFFFFFFLCFLRLHLCLRLGFVYPLQNVALHQCLPLLSVCCFPDPGGSLLPCYVVLLSSAWSSSQSLPSPWLPLCTVFGPPILCFSFIIDGILAYYQHAGQTCWWRVFHLRCLSCSLLTYWSNPQRQWGLRL